MVVNMVYSGFSSALKGLGRSGQGSTDHIKVRVKNDSYGLGANAADEVRLHSLTDSHKETATFGEMYNMQ